jgi:hypothetical protein
LPALLTAAFDKGRHGRARRLLELFVNRRLVRRQGQAYVA